MQEYVKDFNTRQIVGILEHKPNGDVYAIDFNTRQILAIYRKAYDDTIEFNTRQVVAKGNVAVSFIYNKR
ncbi:MAG: hypothetical protein IJD07_03590 [Clostridia bacterium]|nr:hypothetical protein [Clostridia bacterium]